MNKALLNIGIQDFIFHYKEAISKLAFAGSPFEEVSVQELIQQIEGRAKAEKKLPTWFKTRKILYPKKLNLEQSSSETTSKYKASLIEGSNLADITGGFGVDSYFFSENIKQVQHFEHAPELSLIAEHNFKVLGKNNIECSAGDGLQAVLKKPYDIIYADPSRRHGTKGKVFFLKDCEPNIPENLPGLLDNCKTLLLKTSPMLDLSAGLKELPNVFEIHIVAVNNEVKELLWLLKKGFDDKPVVTTINFNKNSTNTFRFNWLERAAPQFGQASTYLYEPNAAIMKSGAFDLVSEKYKLNKLHPHTHLYTSETLVDFPGRRFVIKKTVPYTKQEMRGSVVFEKANIAARNFPETPAALHKKWKINDGGPVYLFFFTDNDNKRQVLICEKVE